MKWQEEVKYNKHVADNIIICQTLIRCLPKYITDANNNKDKVLRQVRFLSALISNEDVMFVMPESVAR